MLKILKKKRTNKEQQLMQKTTIEYLISRLALMAHVTDPAYFNIEDIAQKLDIVLDMPTAKEALYEVFDRQTALDIETMLTGRAWRDDRDEIRTGA